MYCAGYFSKWGHVVLAIVVCAAIGGARAQESGDAIEADARDGAAAVLDDDTLSALVANLRVEERHDRVQALYTLIASVKPEDMPALIAVLEDRRVSPRIQWRLIRALGMMKAKIAEGLIVEILTDPERPEGARQAAAITLGELGGKQVPPALLKAIRRDPEPLTRMLAMRSFYLVQGKAALYDLNRARPGETDENALAHIEWYTHLIRQGFTFAPRPRPGETITCSFEGTKYLVYTPTGYDADVRHDVLVSVHGTFGSAERYLEIAKKRAEAEGVVLVAPWFDASTFPSFDNFNLDNIGIGLPRTDTRLLDILDALAKIANVRTDQFYLFGHSKGGQFTQRFVFAHPDRVIRAASCAPGIYITPDENFADGYGAMFPYGPAPNPFAPDLAHRTFKDLASAPIMFFVGSKDPRIKEAYYFLQAAQLRAARYVYKQRVELKILPEVTHNGEQTFPPAAVYLFGGS